MNLITYRFGLDLAKHGSQVILSGMKVGDTNRAIDVALTVNGEPFYLGAEHAAQIRAHVFTDQGEFQFTNACKIKNNRVFYIVDPAILSAAGDVQVDLEIGTAGTEFFSTAKFVFFVTGTVSDDGDIPGDQYASVITALAAAERAESKSISKVEKDNYGNLVISLLDGTEYDVGNIIGPQGERGPQGEQGIQGEKGERGEGAVYYKYDFNGDGVVNEDDVQRLLYYVNFSQAPEHRLSWWSDPDVNGDGEVGNEDATTLKKWLDTGNEAAFAIVEKNELVDDHFSATSEKPIQNKAVSAGVANALKGTASGTAVAMKDVSPLEHNIGVKLASKNHLTYPYKDTTKTANGITYTDNGDGTISIDGTPTAGTDFVLSNDLPLTAGTYTFSLGLDTTDIMVASVQFASRATGSWVKNVAQIEGKKLSVTFTLSEEELKENRVIISVNAGYYRVEKHLVLYPQVEPGTTATAYAPYVADVSSVTLKKCGKNLVDVSQMLNKNLADNGDGTFTYTRASSNYHSEAFPLQLKAGTTIALNMEQISTTDADDRLTCVFIYADGTSKSSYIGRGSAMSFTADKDVVRVQLFSYNAGTVFVFKNFQIELGTTASEYEIFKESVSYPVKKDGTVDGVMSLYPTTTLLTDTEGVIISAEYNRDVNKALADLEAKLQALILEV